MSTPKKPPQIDRISMRDIISLLKKYPARADMKTWVIMIDTDIETGHSRIAIIAATMAPYP